MSDAIDFAAAALACRRANASYVEKDSDCKVAFEKLGDTWIGQYADSSHQACLSVDLHGQTWLSIAGTRASDLQIGDILRDVALVPVAINGGHVTTGAAEGMDRVYDWAMATAPKGAVFQIVGHSLGAVSATLAPAYLAPSQIGTITSLAAPKFVAADFFASHAAVFERLMPVVSGADGWASWPWRDPAWQYRAPVETLWLENDQGAFAILSDGNRWTGGWSFADHDVDRYQARLDKVAAASVKPAA